MIPVDQTTYGPNDGNCFSACIASILEVPLASVPRVYNLDGDLLRWLATQVLSATLYDASIYMPPGYAIAAGPSLRFAGRMHACVAYDGRVVHDPHPSRDGLPFGVVDFVVIHGSGGKAMWFNAL